MFLLLLSWTGLALSCIPSLLRRQDHHDDQHRRNLLPESRTSLSGDPPAFMQTLPQQDHLGLRLDDVRGRLNSRQIEKIQRFKEQLKEQKKQRAKAAAPNKGTNKTKCIIRTSSVATKEGSCILMGSFCRIPGHGLYSDQVKTY